MVERSLNSRLQLRSSEDVSLFIQKKYYVTCRFFSSELEETLKFFS